ADVALLHGTRSASIGNNALVLDTEIAKELADARAVGVVTDDAGQRHTRAQRAQHRRHAARPTQPLFALVRVQQDHPRFLADAFGVAPHVAVEHEIADHQHARLAQALHQIYEFGRHTVSRENPKSESRNPKQIRINPKSEVSNTNAGHTGLVISSFPHSD